MRRITDQAECYRTLKEMTESMSAEDRLFWNPSLADPCIVFEYRDNAVDMGGRTCQGLQAVGHLSTFANPAKQHCVKLGVAIAEKFRGVGLSKTIMRDLMMDATLSGYSKIWCTIHRMNTASFKMLENAGFEVEGVFRGEESIGGELRDVISMARFLNKPAEEISWGRPEFTPSDFLNLSDCCNSKWLSSGPWVEKLEEDMCRLTHAKHAIAMNNGTSCLLAIFATHFNRGDKVIMPAFCFPALPNTVLLAGLEPVYCDVEPNGNLDLDKAESIIKQHRIKGIAVVDVGGHPNDVDRLQRLHERYDVRIVEDAASALGSAYKGRPIGSCGWPTMFSFHAAKIATTVEGGVVVTDNERLAEQLRRFRNHGQQVRGTFSSLGLNLRLTDMQAAIGCSQVQRLGKSIKRRQEIVQRYKTSIETMGHYQTMAFQPVSDYVTIHSVMPCLATCGLNRSVITERFKIAGIPYRLAWPAMIEESRFYPVAEAISGGGLFLPLSNNMTDAEVFKVIEAAR